MIHDYAEKLSFKMLHLKIIDNQEIYCYGIECFMATLIQLILIFGMALLLGIFWQTAIFVVCLSSLKKYIGGYHAKSHFACITITTFTTLTCCTITAHTPHKAAVIIILACTIFSCLIVFMKAPLINRSTPLEKVTRFKHRSRFIITAQAVLIPALTAANLLSIDLLLSASLGFCFASLTLLERSHTYGNSVNNKKM